MNLILAATSTGGCDHTRRPREADLEHTCYQLAAAQEDNVERFTTPDLWSVRTAMAEAELLHRTIDRIACQPARTWRGIRAKATALKSLLQGGETEMLDNDASATDRLAWSLVQDLLAADSPLTPNFTVPA